MKMLPSREDPAVIQSLDFFQPDDPNKEPVEYVENDRPRAAQNVLLKGFKHLDMVVTLYLQVPALNIPLTEPLRPGQMVSLIKLWQHRKSEGFTKDPQFFFVCAGYESLVKEHRNRVTEYCSSVAKIDKHRPKNMLEVPIGGLFGLRLDDGNYMRVRIVKLNLKTKNLHYWAVDEGKSGSCNREDLLYLNVDCTVLSMLVIPGVFETAPGPDQLKKFEEGKYCKAEVIQPKLFCDYAPRKLNLLCLSA